MSDVENTMTLEQAKKLDAEIANLNALTVKLHAETAKLSVEARWHVAVVASGATLAIVAFTKLLM